MSNKPLLIAQHGGPGASNHRESEISFADLADCWRVLVFDARGGGESVSCGPYKRARWAADVEELRYVFGDGLRFMRSFNEGGS